MAQRGSPETVKRKELVGKLNETCLRAFSAAAQGAKTRGNPYVELAHFIEALSRSERTDFDILCQSAGVDGARLEGDIQRAIDKGAGGDGALQGLRGEARACGGNGGDDAGSGTGDAGHHRLPAGGGGGRGDCRCP